MNLDNRTRCSFGKKCNKTNDLDHMKKFSHIASSVVCTMIIEPGTSCDNPNCLYTHPPKTINKSDSPKQSANKLDLDVFESQIVRLKNRNTKLKDENMKFKEENDELKEKVDSLTKKLAKIRKLTEI